MMMKSYYHLLSAADFAVSIRLRGLRIANSMIHSLRTSPM